MKRFAFPDLLKGFAVFLIIPVHILELFIDYPGRESLFGKTILFLGGPLAVPVFMIIMGYFIAMSSKSLAKNSLRASKVFAVGLLLNIGLNFNLLMKIKFQEWQINPFEYIFGVDILYLAGLSILILSLLKTFRKRAVWIALLLIFVVSGLTGYMNDALMVTERNYAIPFIGGNYSWAYFPLFPWLTYPLAGFVFYYWEEQIVGFIKKQKTVSVLILAGITALVILFAKQGIEITIDLPMYYHHTFLFALWALGVVIIWVAVLRLFHYYLPNTYLSNFLKWLGKNITLFYVIQWLIIGNIATEIYQTQSIDKYFYWFGGIFTVTILLTWLIEKTNIKGL
ncbi:MAG: acyltransferase [Draconibacterium sp.]|nr:acyltransferase [Draconibacterium sp.]